MDVTDFWIALVKHVHATAELLQFLKVKTPRKSCRINGKWKKKQQQMKYIVIPPLVDVNYSAENEGTTFTNVSQIY